MRSLALALAVLLAGCGSDDDSSPKQAEPPKCGSDAKLSGGVSVDASVEYDCADGGGYTVVGDVVTLEVRLPGDQPGVLSVRLFGLGADTSPGTPLPAGLALDFGLPPTDHWEVGMANDSACSATIEAQTTTPTEGELVTSGTLDCSEPLLSGGGTTVDVERLSFQALWEP